MAIKPETRTNVPTEQITPNKWMPHLSFSRLLPVDRRPIADRQQPTFSFKQRSKNEAQADKDRRCQAIDKNQTANVFSARYRYPARIKETSRKPSPYP
jgi:hypothetical protein